MTYCRYFVDFYRHFDRFEKRKKQKTISIGAFQFTKRRLKIGKDGFVSLNFT